MTQLLATLIEAEADDLIVRWIDEVADGLNSENGRRRLQQGFYEGLHAGTLSTAHVIAAAEKNNVLEADLALRQYAAEFIDQGREPELSAQVRAYAVKSVLGPIVNRGRGREVADNWRRDLGIAMMVESGSRALEPAAHPQPHEQKPSPVVGRLCGFAGAGAAPHQRQRAAGRKDMGRPRQDRRQAVRVNSPYLMRTANDLMRTANPGNCAKWGLGFCNRECPKCVNVCATATCSRSASSRIASRWETGSGIAAFRPAS